MSSAISRTLNLFKSEDKTPRKKLLKGIRELNELLDKMINKCKIDEINEVDFHQLKCKINVNFSKTKDGARCVKKINQLLQHKYTIINSRSTLME